MQRVFVSSTSHDLASYREAAKDALLSHGVYPSTQEHGRIDYRTLQGSLTEEISRCDAVICLVGAIFGASPTDSPPPARSYTQFEYDVARTLGKRLYVFLATEELRPDHVAEQSDTDAELQRRHRERLMAAHTCKAFSSATELQLRIGELMTVPGFSGRPAIAVLPFRSMSQDPEQEYFADGVSEDLMARLAKARVFPVIARSSSFRYKASNVDVQQVSRELGAEYLVDGSVRRLEQRLRIGTQLVDATKGHNIWANRYDRDLGDLFALQDEITDQIFAALSEALGSFDRQRAVSKPPESLSAWDALQCGLWHLYRYSKDGTFRARALAQQARALDPQFSEALSLLAVTHLFDILHDWSSSPGDSIESALRAADEAVVLDAKSPTAHTALGFSLAMTGQIDRGLAVFEQALQLNPSAVLALYGIGITELIAERPSRAIPALSKAVRLSPYDPMIHDFLLFLGQAHFVASEYDEAVAWTKRSVAIRPSADAYRVLAASHGYLGNAAEALAAIHGFFQTCEGVAPDTPGLTAPSPLVGRYLEGWQKAGWQPREHPNA